MTIDPEIPAETVMAYADGALDAVSAKRVERAMASDPAIARQVAAHRALAARLSAHYAPVADAPVPDRLAALLQGNVVAMEDVRAQNLAQNLAQRRWLSGPGFGTRWAAIAATLVIGLVIGQAIDLHPAAIGDRSGALVAQAGLAKALDTQLASSQPGDAATRIGLTFRDQGGAVCRTFEGAAMAGIACRNGADWQLRTLSSGGAQPSTYRQAGSDGTAQAAQAMMAGAPFDAAQERAALAKGWK